MSQRQNTVPDVRHLLAVCADPYDVTFALGAVVGAFSDAGTSVHILCFTHGPGPDIGPQRRFIRASELGEAARLLGAEDVTLLEYAAGQLSDANLGGLAEHVLVAASNPDALLTIDATGIDALPDRVRTMRAAIRAATKLGSPVYGWTADPPKKERDRRTVVVDVDRTRQRDAIVCHTDLPADDVLRSRWPQLQRHQEHLVVLCPERAAESTYAQRFSA